MIHDAVARASERPPVAAAKERVRGSRSSEATRKTTDEAGEA